MENNETDKDAEIQKSRAIAHEILRHSHSQKHVKNSRTTLFALAGLFFLYAIFYGAGIIADDIVSLIFYSAIGVVYIFLGSWANSSPKPAAIVGLVVYLSIIILIGFVDYYTLYKGLLIKIIVIVYLVRGIMEANKLPKKDPVSLDTLDGNMIK